MFYHFSLLQMKTNALEQQQLNLQSAAVEFTLQNRIAGKTEKKKGDHDINVCYTFLDHDQKIPDHIFGQR